uniref:Putative secreted protein n=1 Tax=Anopheles triannulatus TaxID=58253 RepID=A0A2M4B1Y9_9DIPT
MAIVATVGHVLQVLLLLGAQVGKVQQLHRHLVARLREVDLLCAQLIEILVNGHCRQRADRHPLGRPLFR